MHRKRWRRVASEDRGEGRGRGFGVGVRGRGGGRGPELRREGGAVGRCAGGSDEAGGVGVGVVGRRGTRSGSGRGETRSFYTSTLQPRLQLAVLDLQPLHGFQHLLHPKSLLLNPHLQLLTPRIQLPPLLILLPPIKLGSLLLRLKLGRSEFERVDLATEGGDSLSVAIGFVGRVRWSSGKRMVRARRRRGGGTSAVGAGV
ncbi:hypothetical protein BCR35DRAFT_303130 [Leucosporidium creatinivorum]|uniref:Uncharacterized protein n=1 Tax=Leucosporidium creatinivorum TaxID=106004 RepID=A0A1Y2FJG0_9BASI|nr:hypothetical protein BCR35DRAFT_303130 [Leucosporidium creatinivorum]